MTPFLPLPLIPHQKPFFRDYFLRLCFATETEKALTLGDVFPLMEAAEQAIKKYIVSRGESYRVEESNTKKEVGYQM